MPQCNSSLGAAESASQCAPVRMRVWAVWTRARALGVVAANAPRACARARSDSRACIPARLGVRSRTLVRERTHRSRALTPTQHTHARHERAQTHTHAHTRIHVRGREGGRERERERAQALTERSAPRALDTRYPQVRAERRSAARRIWAARRGAGAASPKTSRPFCMRRTFLSRLQHGSSGRVCILNPSSLC